MEPSGGGTGERLGPYALGAEIGRGAMGVVYRARHEGLGRDCALKVIRLGSPPGASPAAGAPGLQQPAALAERFRREAQAVARLGKHPNIVACFDAGEADDRLYFAMELCEGRDLARRIAEEGPLPEREALDIVRKVAIAVGHAHARGIVHRDLKPSNILVDASGEPLLTDFGLAFDRGRERLTADGDALGTPEYMAPEQALAETDKIGPRTDVFALGVTLYDLLAGDPPFTGSALSVATHVILDPPPRLRRKRPDCSSAAEAIAHQAMEKEPARRYPSALALADDLARALDGERPRAPALGLRYETRRLARRHPRVAVAVVAWLFACALGAGAWAVAALAGRLARRAAEARALEAFAAEDLDRRIAVLEDAAALDPSFAGALLQLADAHWDRSIVHYREGDWDGYEGDLRAALTALGRVSRADAGPAVVHLEATFREWLGEIDAALALYDRAADLDPDGLAGAEAAAAAALLQGNWAEAEEAAARAIARGGAAGESAPYFRRGVARLALGRLAGALADADQVWDRQGDDWSAALRGRVLLAQGEVRLAGQHLAEAVLLSPCSPAVHAALAELARVEGRSADAALLDAEVERLARGRRPLYLDQASRGRLPRPAAVPASAGHLDRARVALAAGDADAALDLAAAAVARWPADPAAYVARAAALRALGRATEALADERLARALAPAPARGGRDP